MRGTWLRRLHAAARRPRAAGPIRATATAPQTRHRRAFAPACTPSAAHPQATSRLVRAATLCLINRERTRHGERALRRQAPAAGRPGAHHDMAGATTSPTSGGWPGGGTPLDRMRSVGYIYSSHRLRSGREHRLGNPLAGDAAGDRRHLDDLARAPREHPRPPLPRHRHRRRSSSPIVIARRRPAGGHLHTGLRRDHHRLTRSSDRPSPAPHCRLTAARRPPLCPAAAGR